jgi:bisphosphoglycerate-dependent phosphoglycerate mutase
MWVVIVTDKPKSVKRMSVTKSPEVLAGETLIAVLTSDTISEAAEKLGITRQMVHVRIVKYELQDKIKNLLEEARNEMVIGSGKAARSLVKLLDSEDERTVKSAADSILDRVGLTKIDNNSTASTIYQFGNINNDMKAKYDD